MTVAKITKPQEGHIRCMYLIWKAWTATPGIKKVIWLRLLFICLFILYVSLCLYIFFKTFTPFNFTAMEYEFLQPSLNPLLLEALIFTNSLLHRLNRFPSPEPITWFGIYRTRITIKLEKNGRAFISGKQAAETSNSRMMIMIFLFDSPSALGLREQIYIWQARPFLSNRIDASHG